MNKINPRTGKIELISSSKSRRRKLDTHISSLDNNNNAFIDLIITDKKYDLEIKEEEIIYITINNIKIPVLKRLN